jgi:hypothetical protein
VPYRFLFRGERRADSWRLAPTIERGRAVAEIIKTEKQLFFDFQSKAHLYIQNLPHKDDKVAWLSLMQHHRLPTRLLDWIFSPYVALFFAFEAEVDSDDGEPGAIWAVDWKRLDARAHLIAAELFNFPSQANFCDPERFDKMAFPHAFLGSARGLVVHLLPSFQNTRLSAQQGTFLFSCNYNQTFEESLHAMMQEETDEWLHKIVFPRTKLLRLEVLSQLAQFNVQPASLYPDLDGLARFLTLKIAIDPPK